MNPLPVRLLPEARQEFDEAIDWYAERDKSLAIDFITKLRAVFNRIAIQPQLHAVVYRGVRKAVVRRFPYVVVYQEDQNEVLIISIMHTARSDVTWKQRLQ